MTFLSEVVCDLDRGAISSRDLLALASTKGSVFRRHPLGFFAATLLEEKNRRLRMHVWPTGGPGEADDFRIHNHAFDFMSWVIAGVVEHTEYCEEAEGVQYSVLETRYAEEASILVRTGLRLTVAPVARHIVAAGERYLLQANVLHHTYRVSDVTAVTAVVASLVNRNAIVLGPLDCQSEVVFQRSVVPFSQVQELIT